MSAISALAPAVLILFCELTRAVLRLPRKAAPRTVGTMSVRVVRLGSPRLRREGVRIGTVRRPPRGVPKSQWAARDFYDVWLPELAPSEALLKVAQAAADERAWKSFARRYSSEMSQPATTRLLDLLAALSHSSDFSVGCYCADEARCHRSLLRTLLLDRGAALQ